MTVRTTTFQTAVRASTAVQATVRSVTAVQAAIRSSEAVQAVTQATTDRITDRTSNVQAITTVQSKRSPSCPDPVHVTPQHDT